MQRRQESEEQLRQMHKIEAIGQLTGGIAHDFNNMLAVVISALGLLKRRLGADRADPEINRFVDGARQAAERAANLTARLLAFSRQQALAPEVVDVHDFFAEWRELAARTLPENIETTIELAPGVWLLFVDRHSLENTLLNLAINARDAMPGGGRLRIEIFNVETDEASTRYISSADQVLITVSDTGSGIPQEMLDRVFDPFFTTKPSGEGTGLGLSQVHGFVKQSNGRIEIESTVGKGTVVKLYFPRSEQDITVLPRSHTSHVSTGQQRRGTVLVVEDQDEVRLLTAATLRELGYDAIEASDAESALAVLSSHSGIDVMLTDVVMPGIDGKRLAEHAVKQKPILAVVFMTGYAKSSDIDRFRFKSDQLITKPFTLETLSTKIQLAFNRKHSLKISSNSKPGSPIPNKP
jgi:CheY-like chemotaxis protein